VGVGIFLVLLVLFQGPAEALNLGLQEFSDASPGKGDKISTTASIDINQNERVNLDFLVLNISGSVDKNCKFYPNATIISGCEGIEVTLLADNSTFGNGYGYSYNNYGYGYRTGYTGGTLTYNVTLDTLYFIPNSYNIKLSTSINQTVFDSGQRSIVINSSSLSLLQNFYYNGENVPIDSGLGLVLFIDSSSSGNVSVVNYSTNFVGSAPSGKIAFGKFYEIDADSQIKESMGLSGINISYTSGDLVLYGINESTLRLYYYNISSGNWQIYDGIYGGVDIVNNTVWAKTTHFSIFGIFGEAGANETLPNNVQIAYPLSTTYTTDVSELNYTSEGSSCWYSTNLGVTNSSAVSAGINFTGLSSNEGTNTWTVYCNDSSNNLNSSSVTFFKDTIAPIFSEVVTTNESKDAYGTVVRGHNVTLNVTADEITNETGSVWLKVWEGSVDSPIIIWQGFLDWVTGGRWTTTLETNNSFPLGDVNYTIYANDSLGNEMNLSSNFTTIIGDTPVIVISSPLAQDYSANVSELNYSATDSDGLSSCWYSLDFGATNSSPVTVINEENVSNLLTSVQGSNTWTVYCNDSFGNENSSSVIFNVNADTSNLFISTWNTSKVSGNKNVTLPLYNGGTYNFTADWGDGTTSIITSWDSVNRTHEYATAGNYTITIDGTIIGFRFSNGGDKLKITDISQWGNLNLGSLNSYFYGCSNLKISATDVLNMTGTTSMLDAFRFCFSLTTVPSMNSWNMSQVTYMSGMFDQDIAFNQDISSWDTSKVTTMEGMFSSASVFNQNLSNWNTSQVTNMRIMFMGATSFNGNISNWDTHNVTTTNSMFYQASAFNQSIGNWNTSQVTNMGNMFFGATAFNQDISRWDTSKVNNMNSVFNGASAFNQPIGSWNTSQVTTMQNMLSNALVFNQNISSWDISKVTIMTSMFYQASAFNQSIGNWNTSQVTNMDNMFWGASAFNQNITGWDTSGVIIMSNMFNSASTFNQSIGNWNTSKVTNMNGVFRDAAAFNQNISGWDTSKVTSMSQMFYYARSFNQNIGSWNVSKVTDMSNMFTGIALSTANYDSLLIGWASLPVLKDSILFYAGNSKYCSGLSARNTTLVGTYHWTIMDGGLDPSCDVTIPSVAITFPLNTTYDADVSELNYTASDTNLLSCKYSLDNGVTNTTVTCGNNLTGLTSNEGTNTWKVWALDSQGNENSSSVTFYKDTTTKNIVLNNFLEYYKTGDRINVSGYILPAEDGRDVVIYAYDVIDQDVFDDQISTNETGDFTTNFIINSGTEGLVRVYAMLSSSNATANKTFVYDKSSPITRLKNIDSRTRTTPEISGNSTDNYYLDYINLYINFTTSLGTYYWNFTGQEWTNVSSSKVILANETFFGFNITDGPASEDYSDNQLYFVYAQATDKAGNIGNLTTKNFTFDITAPFVGFISPTTNKYRNVTINLLTSEDALNVWWFNETNNLTYTSQVSYSFSHGNHTIYAYANDSSGNLNTTSVTFEIDLISPELRTVYPENISYSSAVSEFNYTINESNGFCWYSLDSGNTNSSVVIAGTNFTELTSVEGSNTWTVYCNDSVGNENSSTVIFIVDTIAPEISIASPLNITYNSNVSSINYTLTESNGFCWYSLDLGVTNSSAVSAGTNFTELTSVEGSNTWTVYCNDSVGNLNSSSVTFFKDTINPEVSIVYPLNTNYNVDVSTLDYIVNDSNLATCKYSLDNGATNTTITCGTNLTGLVSVEGTNTWTVYVIDVSGNENSSSVTFFKDTVAPTIGGTVTINKSGTINGTVVRGHNVTINATVDGITNSTGNVWAKVWMGVVGSPIVIWQGFLDWVGGNIWSKTIETNSSFPMGQVNYTIYANDSLGNQRNLSSNFTTIIGDTPNIVISSPLAQNYSTDVSELNYSATDSDGVLSCWYSLDSGNTNSSTVAAGTDFTGLVSVEGTNTWTVYCNDSFGNVNSSSVTFFKDTILPQIAFISPTTESGNYSVNSIAINVSATDTNLKNLTINIYNSSGLFRANTSYSTNLFWSLSLPDNTYYVNATVYDSVSNRNTTETRTILIDTSAPTFTNLQNITTYRAENLYYDFNANDNGVGVDCFSVNDTEIFNINCLGELSNKTELNIGVYFVNITVNDSLSNKNSSIVKITVLSSDLEPPSINITNPLNISYTSEVSEINYTLTETDGYCWYSNSSGAWNSSVVSAGTNFTNVTSKQGSNSWTVYCNDSSGNLGQKLVTFFKDTINPEVSIVYPLNTTYNVNVSQLSYIANDTNLATCKYSLDNGATNITITCGTNLTGLVSTQGTNTWTVYVVDSVGNENSSSVTFFKDTIAPTIDSTVAINGSGTAGGVVVRGRNVTINATVSGITNGTGNVWVKVWMGVVGSPVVIWQGFLDWVSGNLWSKTIETNSSFPLGQVNYTIYANDSLGNQMNLSSNFTTIPIDISGAILIVYPVARNYSSDVLGLNYTLTNDFSFSRCWWSNSSGRWNSTSVAAGVNFTGLVSKSGNNTWTVYCNDSSGNLGQQLVTFVRTTSQIGLARVYPLTSINVSQNYFFNVSVNVSCSNGDCGQINVTLDPQITNYTFTTCGATGRTGPSQAQCNSNYSGTLLANKVDITNGYQYWTVPAGVSIVTIEAVGASGGTQSNAGKGAKMKGTFAVTPGQQLKILVGQKGSVGTGGSAGGGGGSFVTLINNTPLIIAGGGGGSLNPSSALYNANANNGTSGFSTGCASGGTSGSGGSGCAAGNGASGGGGLLGDGTNGNWGTAGQSFINGGLGGSTSSDAVGGFGCGGGTHGNTGGGGGGGGYSGGAGGSHDQSTGNGGGAGSYNSGTNQNNSAGINLGDGYIVISTSGKSGTISMNSSASPFYTTVMNPYNLSLNEGESQIITWTVNATGGIDTPFEFYVYANKTSNNNISSITSKWNVTIIDTTLPIVSITSPTNITYNVDVYEINYTYFDINPGFCWYSNSSGAWNSTAVVAGTNFINVTSQEGTNTWTVYCNDSSGNTNSSEITFIKRIPRIGLELLYPLTSINVSYGQMFNVSVNVSCSNVDCGELNVSLDPTSDHSAITCLNDYSGNNCTGNLDLSSNTLCGYGFVYPRSFQSATNLSASSIKNVTLTMWHTSCDSENILFYLNGVLIRTIIDPYDCVCSPASSKWSEKIVLNASELSVFSANWNVHGSNNLSILKVSGNIYSSLSYVNITYGASAKGGLILMNSSATPFYTTVKNPYNLSLNEGESQIITWLVNATGSLGNSYEFYVYANKTAYPVASNITQIWNVTIKDTTAPGVSISYPLNITYNVNVSQLNYTLTEANGYCWYSNSSGAWNSSAVSAGTNFINVISREGSNSWTVYCNDSSGNTNSSSVTFFKDTIYPRISFNNDTTPSGISNLGSVIANVSVIETNIDTVIVSLYNSTGLVNITNSTSSSIYLNFSSLPLGTYYLNATVNDSAGNTNATETRIILLRPTINVSLIYPTNNTDVESKLFFNVTVNVSCENYGCGELNVSLRANVNQTFYSTGTYQYWTVPAGVTSVTILTKGASGGYTTGSVAGKGASMQGTFNVTPGQTLTILVGESPGLWALNFPGGGGGSFVALGSDYLTAIPMIVAGGGGGSATSSGVNAPTTESGTGDSPGTNGNGAPSLSCSGGGGGFYTSGGDDTLYTGQAGVGGKGFRQGGTGGYGTYPQYYQRGGFGGGAEADYIGACNTLGGSGGGYSGGSGTNSGRYKLYGEAGGSFNNGTNQTNLEGNNVGNGTVTLVYISSVSSVAGATPFYTNESNPRTVTLNKSQTLNLTYFVNATGTLNTAYEFFAYAITTNSQNFSGESSHIFITIRDTISPTIDFNEPTINTGNYSQNSIWANVTSQDYNPGNVTIYLYNDNGVLINSSTFGYYNFTGLSDGKYYLNATAVDLGGNKNYTETRVIIIDRTAPTITIVNPKSQAYGRDKNLPLNYMITGSPLDVESCWYNVVNTTGTIIPNTTIAGCNNLTFNVSGDETYTLTLYANDSLNNMASSVVSFEVVILPPTTVLNSPENNSWVNSKDVTFNFTTTDSDGIGSCDLYGNFDGTWHKNKTLGLGEVINGSANIFSLTLGDGEYLWSVWCKDTNGYGKFAFQNKTFYLDSVAPTVNYDVVTEANGTIFSRTSIYAGVTITELHPKNITFVLYNATSLVNSTTYALGDTNLNNSINWTNLSNGDYYYNITVRDNANNINSTQNRFIALDTTAPNISFVSPSAESFYSTVLIVINITNSSRAVNVWWNNGTDNLTYTGPIYYNFTDGKKLIYGYANDSLGNVRSASVSFYVDTILPQVAITNPLNTTYNISVNSLNYTTNDTNPRYCWYSNDSGATNSSSVEVGINFTGVGFVQRTNKWTVYCIDAAGNVNSSSVIFNVDTVLPISNFSYPRMNSMLNRLSMINGTSEDSAGPISLVEIQVIYNNGTNKTYWNGEAWASQESWLSAHGTNFWYYNVTENNINFSSLGPNANVSIRSRALDNASNYQTSINEVNFTYGITTEIVTSSDLIGAYHGFKIAWENKSMKNYKVYYNISAINSSNLNLISPYAVVSGNLTQYNSSNLSSGTWNKNYSFAVRTVDENGVESEYIGNSVSSKIWRYKIEIMNVSEVHNYAGEIGWRMNYRVRVLGGLNSEGIAILELLGPGNYSQEVPNKVQWISRATQSFNGFLSTGSYENYNSGLVYDGGDYKGWNMIWNMLPSQSGSLEVYADKYENSPVRVISL